MRLYKSKFQYLGVNNVKSDELAGISGLYIYYIHLILPLIYLTNHLLPTWLIFVERVAERLRHGTRDLGVWGSIPGAPVRCKSLGQALNPHCLWPPSSNGYLVHRFKGGSIVAAEFYTILSRGKGKMWWTLHRDLDVKQIPLPWSSLCKNVRFLFG